MRSLYFTAAESGMTRAQLRHGEATGRWRKVDRLTYRFGSDPVTKLDRCIGLVLSTGGVATGTVAGVLLGLDSVRLESALRKGLVKLEELVDALDQAGVVLSPRHRRGGPPGTHRRSTVPSGPGSTPPGPFPRPEGTTRRRRAGGLSGRGSA